MVQPMQVGQQEQLPIEAEQLAGIYQLGMPKAQYKVNLPTQTVITWTIMGVILGGICFFAALGASNLPAMIFLLLIGLIFVGIALYYVFTPVIYRSWRVYVCTDGFVFKRGSKIEAFHWEQIEAMWQAVTKHYRNSVHMGTSHKYTVRRKDGVQAIFNDRFANVEALGNTLSREINTRLWPQVVSAYQAGNAITFGPLSISMQGVSNGRELLPWSQITEMGVNQGVVTVRQGGKWLRWSAVMARDIPNIFVFMRLVNYVLKEQKRPAQL